MLCSLMFSCRLLNNFRCRSMQTVRHFCAESAKSEGETKIETILRDKFPKAVFLEAKDISGGCGSMYEIHVHSDEFNGVIKVQQHRLVSQALGTEISDMHGVRIFTRTSKETK